MKNHAEVAELVDALDSGVINQYPSSEGMSLISREVIE